MKKITLLMALIVSAFTLQMSAQNFQGETGTIPDGSCPDLTPFNADVTGIGTIGDTHQIDEVVINITHTWVGDLDIVLVAPSGESLLLVDGDTGNAEDDFFNTVFTDEGNPPTINPSFGAPWTGEFSPQGGSFVDAFNGVDGSGTWSLRICDAVTQDIGTVTQWSIRFQDNPESCPAPLNVAASNITSTAFDITWVDPAAADEVEFLVLVDGAAIPADPISLSNPDVVDYDDEPTGVQITDISALDPATDYDVYMRSICGGTPGPWSAVVDVTTEEVCPAPTALAIDTDATTNDAITFTFETANNSTATEWEVVESGDAPFAGNDVQSGTTTGTSVTVSGLDEQTTYDVYIRNNCPDAAPDDVSSTVGPVSDTTLCDVKVAPYTEDFTDASFLGDPECFSQTSDAGYVYQYNSPGNTSNNEAAGALDHTDGAGNFDFAYVDGSFFVTDTPGNTYLVTPEVDVTGLADGGALRFSVHSRIGQADLDAGESFNSLIVQVNDGTGFTTVESLFNGTETSDPALPGWEDFTIDLEAEGLSGVLQVRFNTTLTGSTAFLNDILIDDISFDELGCLNPENIEVDDIEFDSATISFDAFSTAINGHFVAVVEPGVDPEIGPYIFDDNLAAGVDSVLVEGLEPLSCYEVYVRSICDGETSGFNLIPIEFCTPGQCDGPDAVSIDNVDNMGADFSWDAVDGVLGYEYVAVVAGGDADVPGDQVAGTAGTADADTTSASVSLPDGAAFQIAVRSVCDPEGVSVWVYSDVFMTDLGCNSNFYDTGGPTGDYTDLEDYTVTIYPSDNAAAVSLEFTLVDLEFGEDFLSVYNGEDTSSPLSLDVTGPSIFTSTDPSGALTVRFESDGADVGAGWEATITCSILNDVCATAIELIPGQDFDEGATEASNLGATDSGVAGPSCATYGGGDVWYTVEVPESGSITIETQESPTSSNDLEEAAIVVYSGSCGTLTEIACDLGSGVGAYSLVTLDGLTAGDTLYIRVFGSDSAGFFGDFIISTYDESLSTDDLEAAGFNFYPNPVQDQLNVTAQENIQNVEVFNLLGQSVAKMSPNALNATVDMSNLNAGVYLINVTINDQTGAYRIIKQ